jgi:copper chaperone CopZ
MGSALTDLNIMAAVVAALGAPGVTFYVMKKMTSSFMEQNLMACKKCRAEIDAKIIKMNGTDQTIIDRQMSLREIEIPTIRETYVKKCDVQASTAEIKQQIKELGQEIKADIQRVHERIDNFHERGMK